LIVEAVGGSRKRYLSSVKKLSRDDIIGTVTKKYVASRAYLIGPERDMDKMAFNAVTHDGEVTK
jgi:hypothetical protein